MANSSGKKKKMYYLGNKYQDVYFTKREAQCMSLLIKGHTIASAAVVLRLSSRTVEFYLKNMKMKLNCKSKAELIERVIKSDFMQNIDFDLTQNESIAF